MKEDKTTAAQKYIDTIYNKEFFPEHGHKRYKITKTTFSNNKILDCLEKELNSPIFISGISLKLVSKKSIKSILIVGPGSGGLGNRLRIIFPKAKLYELDINKFVITRLKKKHSGDRLRAPLLGNANNIPLPGNSIDLIIAYSVFRYITDVKTSIKELNRLLTRKGIALVAEGKTERVVNRLYNITTQLNFKPVKLKSRPLDLPRLTFFYWLLSIYKVRRDIKTIVNFVKKEFDLTTIDAIFRIAGRSRGIISGIRWQKI